MNSKFKYSIQGFLVLILLFTTAHIILAGPPPPDDDYEYYISPNIAITKQGDKAIFNSYFERNGVSLQAMSKWTVSSDDISKLDISGCRSGKSCIIKVSSELKSASTANVKSEYTYKNIKYISTAKLYINYEESAVPDDYYINPSVSIIKKGSTITFTSYGIVTTISPDPIPVYSLWNYYTESNTGLEFIHCDEFGSKTCTIKTSSNALEQDIYIYSIWDDKIADAQLTIQK